MRRQTRGHIRTDQRCFFLRSDRVRVENERGTENSSMERVELRLRGVALLRRLVARRTNSILFGRIHRAFSERLAWRRRTVVRFAPGPGLGKRRYQKTASSSFTRRRLPAPSVGTLISPILRCGQRSFTEQLQHAGTPVVRFLGFGSL